MRVALTEEKMDNILLLRESNVPIAKAAELLAVGESTISRVMTAYEAAKVKDYSKLRDISRGGAPAVIWACRKFQIDYSAEIDGAANDVQEEPKTDNTAQAFLSLLDAVRAQTDALKELTKTVASIDSRLTAMQLTQSGFRGDMGEKIKSVVEAINLNADYLEKELQRANDSLGGIKQNTKKRSYQEVN